MRASSVIEAADWSAFSWIAYSGAQLARALNSTTPVTRASIAFKRSIATVSPVAVIMKAPRVDASAEGTSAAARRGGGERNGEAFS